MSATSDIFDGRHRGGDRPAIRGNGRERAVRGLGLDDELLDEVACRLAAPVAERLADRLAERLTERLTERLADRVAARLGGSAPERREALVDAREIARMTGRSRGWVYDHAGELGAVPLGSGNRPRLGFDPAHVAAQLDAATKPGPPLPVPTRAQPKRRRSEHNAAVEALLNGPV